MVCGHYKLLLPLFLPSQKFLLFPLNKNSAIGSYYERLGVGSLAPPGVSGPNAYDQAM
jgi:hypothetical protein